MSSNLTSSASLSFNYLIIFIFCCTPNSVYTCVPNNLLDAPYSKGATYINRAAKAETPGRP